MKQSGNGAKEILELLMMGDICVYSHFVGWNDYLCDGWDANEIEITRRVLITI